MSDVAAGLVGSSQPLERRERLPGEVLSLDDDPVLEGGALGDGEALEEVSSIQSYRPLEPLDLMVAVYSGDATYDTSTSEPVNQEVIRKPAVLEDPMSQTVAEGEPATFSAEVLAYPTPTYQWEISADGATSAALTLSNVQASQSGNQYRAVFTNLVGSATTRAALLTVNATPVSTSIRGKVYLDLNGDGVLTGDTGLGGITVQLWHPGDGLVATTASGADGAYAFEGLAAGDYSVRIVLPEGYSQTTPNPADIIGLAEGQVVSGVDFGLVLPADLRGEMSYGVVKKTITYTITVTNDGPASAVAATLSDPVPAGTAFVSVTSSVGTCTGGKTVTCSFGTLASGQSAVVTVKVNRTDTKIAIVNVATVAATTFDADTVDNTARVEIP